MPSQGGPYQWTKTEQIDWTHEPKLPQSHNCICVPENMLSILDT